MPEWECGVGSGERGAGSGKRGAGSVGVTVEVGIDDTRLGARAGWLQQHGTTGIGCSQQTIMMIGWCS